MTTEHIDSERELTTEEKLFLRDLEIQRLRDALAAAKTEAGELRGKIAAVADAIENSDLANSLSFSDKVRDILYVVEARP